MMVQFDMQDAGGQIIQFIYGEDGVDPTRSLAGKSIDVGRIITEINQGL
jgi:DNA-directed RNA polymerase subunit A'